MKPAVYLAFGTILGFAIAWMVKPDHAPRTVEMVPQRERVEYSLRSTGQACALTDQAAADIFKRMQRAGIDQEQRNVLFAQIPPGEVPSLLEKLRMRAGFDGLEYDDREALRGLLTSWYLKSPEATLAWLQCVERDSTRNRFVGGIAEDLAGNDLDAAMDLLRKQGHDRLEIDAFSSGLFDAALKRGVDGLLELCQLGLYSGSWRGISCPQVTYPDGFDFRRSLDGLADMKAGYGEDAKFMALPSDLVGEWTKRDPQAAWAWLQQGRSIENGSGKLEFFGSYARRANPAEVAALLAEDFKPEAPAKERYENILWIMDQQPSAEMFDAILEVTPGDRAANLQDMLDERSGFVLDTENIDTTTKLILERMEPGERLVGLRRIFSDIDSGPFELNDPARRGITPLLLRMGHTHEEIDSLFPPDKTE